MPAEPRSDSGEGGYEDYCWRKMSALRDGKYVVAVTFGDLHLTHTPPACRADDDWYATQALYLKQVKGLAQRYAAPVLCTGDVFDDGHRARKVPPELINFALEHLPEMYAVPGQHDLPYHRYEDIKKSAYWTLVEAGKVANMEPGKPVLILDHSVSNGRSPMKVYATGFPWGTPIRPTPKRSQVLQIAVLHAYVWEKGHTYPGAKASQHVSAYQKLLAGYHVAVFGDNHKGFVVHGKAEKVPIPTVFNGGTLIRRKQDERKYRPFIGLIYDDGSVEQVRLKCEGDKFWDEEYEQFAAPPPSSSLEEFVQSVNDLVDSGLKFEEACKQYMDTHRLRAGVKKVILESLEGK
jgi:hypothetical protein